MTGLIVPFDSPVKGTPAVQHSRAFDSLPYIQMYTAHHGATVSVQTSVRAIRKRGIRPSQVVADVVRMFDAEIFEANPPFLLVHDERQGFYATAFLASTTTSHEIGHPEGTA